jgi:hypothetical protein
MTSHKKGISSVQLSKSIAVTQKTAWFKNHRIRECFSIVGKERLNGEIEPDETFVGGKNKNRHWDKKVKNSQGRSFKDKVPVMGMMQRGGKVICKVAKDTSCKSLTLPILQAVKRGSTLFPDERNAYGLVSRLYEHHVIGRSRKQYANGNVYTSTIEGFWGIMKRDLIGIYNHTDRKHLQKYADEFCFRYNTRNSSEPSRLTCKTLCLGIEL